MLLSEMCAVDARLNKTLPDFVDWMAILTHLFPSASFCTPVLDLSVKAFHSHILITCQMLAKRPRQLHQSLHQPVPHAAPPLHAPRPSAPAPHREPAAEPAGSAAGAAYHAKPAADDPAAASSARLPSTKGFCANDGDDGAVVVADGGDDDDEALVLEPLFDAAVAEQFVASYFGLARQKLQDGAGSDAVAPEPYPLLAESLRLLRVVRASGGSADAAPRADDGTMRADCQRAQRMLHRLRNEG